MNILSRMITSSTLMVVLTSLLFVERDQIGGTSMKEATRIITIV